jgi:hypothetical protein
LHSLSQRRWRSCIAIAQSLHLLAAGWVVINLGCQLFMLLALPDCECCAVQQAAPCYLCFKRVLAVRMNMCMDSVSTPLNSAAEHIYWNLHMLCQFEPL